MLDDIKDHITGKRINALVGGGTKEGEEMGECRGRTPGTVAGAGATVAALALGAGATVAAVAAPHLLCVCRKPREVCWAEVLQETQKLPLNKGRRRGREGRREEGRGENVMDETEEVETDCIDGFG